MISKELIRRFKNGDEDAFSFLYKHYWEKVYGFTRLYLVSSEDIAEVVQEVFIKLWEARHLIDEEQPFEGFLFIITRNMIFNYSRKKLNYSFLKVTVLQAMEQEYEEENKLELSDLKKYLSVLISQFRELIQVDILIGLILVYLMGLALKYLRKNLYLLSLFLSV